MSRGTSNPQGRVILANLVVGLLLSCTTHVLTQSEERVGTEPVCHYYRLEVLREPSIVDPQLVFSADRVDSLRDTECRKTVLARSLLGLTVKKETLFAYSQAKRSTRSRAIVNVVGGKDTFRIAVGETTVVSIYDLASHLGGTLEDADAVLTLVVSDTPQVSRSITLAPLLASEVRRRIRVEQDSIKKAHEEFLRRAREEARQDSIRRVQERERARLEAERRRRDAEQQSRARSQDAVIAFGMSQAEIEGLIGRPDWPDDTLKLPTWSFSVERLTIYNPKDLSNCLILKYSYSHFAGAHLLDGASYAGLPSGFDIGSGTSSLGAFPATYTGRLRRENGFWSCEYYWKGERKWTQRGWAKFW
jgi:hypothetical protein